jgi:hypothetical protein
VRSEPAATAPALPAVLTPKTAEALPPVAENMRMEEPKPIPASAVPAPRAAATSAASATAPAPSPPAPASSAPAAPSPQTTAFGLDQWRRVLDVLDETRPDLVAFLKHAVPIGISAELVTLGYEAGNALEASLRSAECSRELRAAASKCWGREPNIVFQAVTGTFETLAESDKKARERQRRAAMDRAEQHPSVREAAEILGARVKRIELAEGS